MQGWVKSYREWRHNASIMKDCEHLAVWTMLLWEAIFEPQERYYGGNKIELEAGQMLITHKQIYELLKIEPTKLRRILNLFKNDGLIDYQTNKHQTLITLRFWGDYQGKNDEANDYQMPNQCRTEQDRENEKEKRSKREKGKEKEEYKNEKKEKKNNPITPYEGEGNELFEEFWRAYPKKIGKGYAQKSFKRLKVSRELLERMLRAIEEQRKSELWTRDKGQYIPNPSTWLNQGRWQDCLSVKVYNEYESFSFGIEV